MTNMGTCTQCGTLFVRNVPQRKMCQYCSKVRQGQSARRAMRYSRHRGNTEQCPCQICGYDEVVDLHHEGKEVYWLCPNHHALITRGKKRIEDYGIKPILHKEL